MNSVYSAWNTSDTLDYVIGLVWGRLQNVMLLIIDGEGGNDKIEEKSGKKFYGLDLPEEYVLDDSQIITAGTVNDIVDNAAGSDDLVLDFDTGNGDDNYDGSLFRDV